MSEETPAPPEDDDGPDEKAKMSRTSPRKKSAAARPRGKPEAAAPHGADDDMDVTWTPEESAPPDAEPKATTAPDPSAQPREAPPDPPASPPPDAEPKAATAPDPSAQAREAPPDPPASPSADAEPKPATPPDAPAPPGEAPPPAPPTRARPALRSNGGLWGRTAARLSTWRRPGRLALAVVVVAALCGEATRRFVVAPVEIALEDSFGERPTALAWSSAGELYVGGLKGSAAVFDAGGARLRLLGPPASRIPLGAVAAILPAPASGGGDRAAVFVYLRASPEGDPLGFLRALDTPTAGEAAPTPPAFLAPDRLVAFMGNGVIVAGEREEDKSGPGPVARLRGVAVAGAAQPVAPQQGRAALPGGGEIALMAAAPRANMALAATEKGLVYEFTSRRSPDAGGAGALVVSPGLRPRDAAVTALAAMSGASPLVYGAVGGANGDLTLLPRLETTGAPTVSIAPDVPAGPARRIDEIKISTDGLTVLARTRNGGLFVVFPDAGGVKNTPAPLRLAIPPALMAELTPDGGRVVAVDAAGIVRAYALSRGDGAVAEIAEVHGHGDVVTLIALSPDGRRLASASLDGRLRLTDLDLAARYFRWPLFATLAAPAPQPLPAYTGPVPASARDANNGLKGDLGTTKPSGANDFSQQSRSKKAN